MNRCQIRELEGAQEVFDSIINLMIKFVEV